MEKCGKSLLEQLKIKAENDFDEYEEFFCGVDEISKDVAAAASRVCCALTIPLNFEIAIKGAADGSAKRMQLLFDKKKYARKAALLNSSGAVFGFEMEYCAKNGDSLRAFLDRLDFALSLYPNHLIFPQLDGKMSIPKATSTTNTIDAKTSRDIAFAAAVFYSYGRAVPWFLSALKALKMSAAAFFADFAEWQRVDNCDFEHFNAEAAEHEEIEKMQLVFLEQKFEEKHKAHIFPALSDIVRLNGAFSRTVSDDEERIVDTMYHPDDLLSPEALDLARFVENIVMQNCSVAVFAGEEGPDYTIL